MIGVALVAFVATFVNGMKASNRDAIEDQIVASFIITSQDGYTPFVAAAGDAAADAPSAETVTHVRSEVAEIDGHGGYLTGIDPRADHRGLLVRLGRRLRRDPRELGDDGMIMSQSFAEDNGVAVGDTVRSAPARERRWTRRQGDVRAAAVLSAPRRREHHDRRLRRARRPAAQPVHVRQRRRASRPRQPRPSSSRRPTASRTRAVQTRQEWIDKEDAEFNEFLDDALRPARPVGDRQPLRDGQHARPLGLRADA